MDNVKKHYTCRWCGHIIEAEQTPSRCDCGKSSFRCQPVPERKKSLRLSNGGYAYGSIHNGDGKRMYAGYDA